MRPTAKELVDAIAYGDSPTYYWFYPPCRKMSRVVWRNMGEATQSLKQHQNHCGMVGLTFTVPPISEKTETNRGGVPRPRYTISQVGPTMERTYKTITCKCGSRNPMYLVRGPEGPHYNCPMCRHVIKPRRRTKVAPTTGEL